MSNEYSFLSGFMQSHNVGRVIAQVDYLKENGSTASILLKWDRSANHWFSFDLEWHATRICFVEVPEPMVLATGPDGIVSVSTMAGSTEEEIDDSLDGPARRGPIRDLQLIAGMPYATGMGRQVYRREGANNWTRQDQGVVLPRGKIELCGFNSIDGLNESNLYAVGFNGEVWQRKDGQWLNHESPTNLVLHRIKVVREDLAYACGQMGTLLRSNGSHWEAIKHDAVTDDLWGMEWFNNELYLACDSGLFRLDGNDDLIAVDMKLPSKASCRHLHANDGVLWSCGPKNVVWTEDGQTWTEVTP
ncbi:sialidase family protein [Marilutibacter alkalisoli]|uniref:Uncharacterized protein n=1 Tax=Marilutibacter alkalisoli TaxID=2591633 RepID=A0A514BMV1_9GAMM|nr:hypothetical protein [Lysobacter alkalisoli]QDH68707.1 hypothetical protein FKV23_00185 [Lysobacter alkalisoli]